MMTYLSDKFIIKHSISEKVAHFNTKILDMINNIFLDNNQKNIDTDRQEIIDTAYPTNKYVLEIYKTGIAIIRPNNAKKLKAFVIAELHPDYEARYKLLEFEYNEQKLLLTVFNRLIFYNKAGKPALFIEDEECVRQILLKILFEREIQKSIKSLATDGYTAYILDTKPEFLYYDYNATDSSDPIQISFVN